MTNAEPFRPQYHFSPAVGWMNDPNGLVYYEGEYHLFFQHYPSSTQWNTMHWGHAVSRDLVHWQHLPIALYPDANGPIFSGSAVVDAHDSGGLVAIFSYQNQTQALAHSVDKGRTWTMYAGNPVLTNPGPTGDFRDPKVFWYAPTQCWIMVISAHDRVKFFTSSNLIDWTYQSDFADVQESARAVWECPDLFPLQFNGQTRWILIVSIAEGAIAGGSGTKYYIGDFDGRTYTKEDGPAIWLDYGKDNYAGVTWNNAPDEERIFIGWMNNWQYANQIPTSPWRGAFTLPRRLALRQMTNGPRMVQVPIPELTTLRTGNQHWDTQLIQPDQTLRVELPSQNFEIIATFALAKDTEIGIKLQQATGHSTSIEYNQQTLTVDRLNSGDASFSPDYAGIYHAPLVLANGQLTLQIFVDWSSVEVFANDGEVVLTNQIFPISAHTHLELYCKRGQTTLRSLDVYNLARIHD